MKTYADFIRSLPCCVCQDDTTVQQHHIIDSPGLTKGMAMKLPEIMSIPLCAKDHRELHESLATFERMYDTQEYYLMVTLLIASAHGWEMKHEGT